VGLGSAVDPAAASLTPTQVVEAPAEIPTQPKKGEGGGGRRIGKVIGLVLGFLGFAVAGAAAVWFVLGSDTVATAARSDVTAIGTEVAAQYQAGTGDPVVLYADGAYTVGSTVIGATVDDPTLAYYPGEGSFCVVITTVEGTSFGYSATGGQVDGSCAPAGVEPIGPIASNTLDASLTTSPYWFGLSIGDCVLESTLTDRAADGTEEGPLTAPTVVPCTDAHAGEVFAIGRILVDDAPDAVVFRQQTRELCEGPKFEEYVGLPYLESTLFYSVLYPSDATWAVGADEMLCLVTEGGSTTTGSLRDTNR
jgi:hypothetical protein